jgi:WD40 repeat protein
METRHEMRIHSHPARSGRRITAIVFLAAVSILGGGLNGCNNKASPDFEFSPQLPPADITEVAFSPDGCCIASSTLSGSIKIWRADSGAIIRTLVGHSSAATSVAYSPSGDYLASAGWDKRIHIWDPVTGELLKTLQGHRGSIETLAFSKKGRFLASGEERGHRVLLWDTSDFAFKYAFEDEFESGRPVILDFSPDDRFLVSARKDLELFRTDSGAFVRRFSNVDAKSVRYSPTGAEIAVGSSDGTIKIIDPTNRKPVSLLAGHTDTAKSLAWSTDGKVLLSVSADDTVRVWHISEGNEGRSVVFPQGQFPSHIKSAAIHPNLKSWAAADGQNIYTGDFDTSTRIQIIGGDPKSYRPTVKDIALSSDSRYLAAACGDEKIRVFNTHTGELIKTLTGPRVPQAVSYLPDSQILLSFGLDSRLVIWDQHKGVAVGVIDVQVRDASSLPLAVSPRGNYVALGVGRTTPLVLDVTDWSTVQPAKNVHGHSRSVASIAFSPNRQLMATGSYDGSTIIWSTEKWIPVQTLVSDTDYVISAVTFSPDSEMVATGDSKNNLRIYDLASGSTMQTKKENQEDISAVTFSPDGKQIVSASWDGALRVWRASDGKLLRVLTGHSGRATALLYSADGKAIVSGGSDTTIRIWDAKEGTMSVIIQSLPENGEWLTFTPEGFYSRSNGATRYVVFRRNNSTFLETDVSGNYRDPKLINLRLKALF